MRFLRVLFGICLLPWIFVLAKFEPYNILGVHRRASQAEVRKAYKQMAKEFHPDKNQDPGAQERFIEITKAYELLSDPERRRNYDNMGITEDTPNFRRQHDYAQYGRFDPFDSFFDDLFGGGGARKGGGFKFNFGGGGGGGGENGGHRIFHKQSITAKAYWNNVVPNTEKEPYLILFYSDWCYTCLRIEPIWVRLVEELEPVGFGVATIHSEHEKELTRKVGAKELPHMVLVLAGRVIHYQDPQFSAVKVIEWIRRKFPYKSVEVLDDSNVDTFLNGWMDNRVRVLLFGHTEVIRLRYLSSSFRYRKRAAYGYIRIGDPNCQKIIQRFSVPTTAKVETLLLFQEHPEVPTASVSMKDLSLETLNQILESNQFLQLPRLSSQEIFDSLCPSESAKSRKRLCVTLITKDDPTHEGYRQSMRDFALEYRAGTDRVKFTYILLEKQNAFVQNLIASSSPSSANLGLQSDPSLRVVILWRKDVKKMKYEWLKERWDVGPDQSNRSVEALKKTLKRLLAPNEVLPFETELPDLNDEHAQSLFVRMANRMIEMVETIRESITRDELLPAVSLVLTVGFIIVGGYVMNYLVKMEEESVQRQLGAKGLKVDKKGKVVPELKIHELRAETYNGMVRLLKPGCRTIVLIVDRESKEKLVPKFYKMAWPYRRNKTIMFGFLYIEKGLPWFKKILNLTLPEPRDININPKNCIGTVLSLNGHRRYFCMFHAKHPEGSRKRIYTANNGTVAGSFMGFDSEMEEDSDVETDLERQPTDRRPPLLDSPDHLPIFEDQLLDGLQMWLDRLFEGSTYRYHINYWPEFPISPSNFSVASNGRS